MTITWYLASACIMLAIICVLSYRLREINQTNKIKRIWSYAALLVVILGCISPMVLKKYIFPKNEKVFSNADYHLIEHLGFNVAPPFYLVNENDVPIASLYDTKEGLVMLDRQQDSATVLTAAEFLEPIFYTADDGNSYQLLNRYYNTDCSDGFAITENGRELYRLKIENDGGKRHYISYLDGSEEGDTSDFNRQIAIGYSLADIVTSTPGIELSDTVRIILEGTSLVRERQNDLKSDLVIMPGYWLMQEGLAINGEVATPDTVFRQQLADGTKIFTGFGFRQTRTMSVSELDSNRIKLRYQLPIRKQLRGEDSKLLITSSIDVAAENDMDGVYLYNIFENEDNLNHINGSIRYAVDNSRKEMRFEVKDLKSIEGDKRDTIVGSDTEFCLQTSGSHENGETEWVFQVHNMRETNRLTFSKIIWWFIVGFVVLVCLRVVTDRMIAMKPGGTASLSGFEIGTYIVILAFGVTRLILAWRSSTFVPLDDIGIDAYTKMRESALPWTVLCCDLVPIGMMLMAWYSYNKGKNNVIGSIKTKISQCKLLESIKSLFNKAAQKIPENLLIIGVYILLVLGLFALKSTPFARFAIIFFPLLLYFGFDVLFINRLKKRHIRGRSWMSRRLCSIGWERPLLLLIATMVFFAGDAGFAVIFFVFSMVRLGVSVLTEESNELNILFRVLGFVGFLVGTFLFILYEGQIMVFAIDHIAVVMPVAILSISGLFVLIIINLQHSENTHSVSKELLRKTIIVISVIGIVGASATIIPPVKDFVLKKGIHMKYRAEVQQLKKGEDIGDLMQKCNFHSSDITFIMRSAQNQWFLNSYLKGGEDLDTYFHLQPHSSKGSSYNTQTTDVVVTRYVKAEHRGMIVELMMLMLLLLISIYCLEVETVGRKNNNSRVFLSMLLFLFVIAFSVYMSATNRTVFMGQDFPFLSIQSRIAVLLPCLLLFLVSNHVMLIMGERKAYNVGKRHVHKSSRFNPRNQISIWIVLSVALLTFAILGWKCVPSKGAEQSDNQFDVNKIINEVTEITERLDYDFSIIQEQNSSNLPNQPLSEVWNEFTSNSRVWKDIQSNGSKFTKSLLEEFDKRQDNEKMDPEELVHVRKRKGIYHLCVNKRFYFIESIIESHYPWMGNLLAAKTPLFFNLSNANNPQAIRQVINSNSEFESNIIPETLRRRISAVQIIRFDTSWTADHEPLLLIKTIPNNQQYFDLESDNLVVHGRGAGIQPATRIHKNDLITINNRVGRTSRTVLTWRYGKDNERYLAKNIWINGRQQLFYPMGKESMWSYQFANLVKNVYGDGKIVDTSYRHQNLRVSIDYDLHKEMYRIISQKNKNLANLSENVRDNLNNLVYENYATKIDNHSKYYVYYNPSMHLFYRSTTTPVSRVKEVDKLVARMNRQLGRYQHDRIDSTVVSNILSKMLQRQFNFSAVVLDGNGRIRLLFDYNRRGQTIDPNNITHYNKFMSDMYRDGSNELERDVLGNKTLQLLNPGPGSTFKPIVYTAVTSSKKLPWNSIDVSGEKPSGIYYKGKSDNGNPKYTWYGGVNANKAGIGYFSIAGGASLQHNNYIVQSNNLYHSVVVLLGMQRFENIESIIGPAKTGKEGFPQFTYNGSMHSFDPDKWYSGNENGIDLDYSVMGRQLRYNFQLNSQYNTRPERYTNYFGNDSIFKVFFEQRKYTKQWCYAETGSLNQFIRQRSGWLSDGFIQMVSGSAPLEVSPLQVATMGMRLASLNSAENISSLNDATSSVAEMKNFDVNAGLEGGWGSTEEYFDFYKLQVLGQMKQVPATGTASALSKLNRSLLQQGYYLYVKTGTLNIEEDKTKRIRNMLVIISNRPFESANNLAELRSIRYYVIYMSYRNVDKSGFSNGQFQSQIEAVVNSDLFKQYMQEGK